MNRLLRNILCVSICCATLTTPVLANDISISIDGEPFLSETAPIIENDRVLVPMRSIMEALGYEIQWDSTTRTVTGIQGDTTISLCVDYSFATVNGSYVALDAYPTIVDGYTYVPLRFLADHSGASLVWSSEERSVSINTSAIEIEKSVSDILADSVVYIQTNKKQGSGVILSEDGLIATNFHLIDGASTIQFKFNDRTIYQDVTTVVGIAPDIDLAILQIDLEDLIPVSSTAEPELDVEIFTIGSPLGEHNVVTEGSILYINDNVIQISAPIQNGSSGGGLFDTDGNLLGITTFFSNNNYFATPVDKLEKVEDVDMDFSEMKDYVYSPSAPSEISWTMNGSFAYISWEAIYDVDCYKVYYREDSDDDFTTLHNTTMGSDQWYWGIPYCFGISSSNFDSVEFMITSVRDNVESEPSDVYRIEF
ncbi:stalk domain-containing protein [Chakrabartyella piscis]|uniref:stalk domain-containing protein n=1 Tax=Chakrabartyella piscis TaxID=2918914 RepID=UPI002958C6E9|nr:stalk domain-containing protein [Chakrabartyella piscis]